MNDSKLIVKSTKAKTSKNTPHPRHTKRQSLLIARQSIFDLKTANTTYIWFDRNILDFSAHFFIQEKLFMCGGRGVYSQRHRVSDFLFFDSFGKSTRLQSLKT